MAWLRSAFHRAADGSRNLAGGAGGGVGRARNFVNTAGAAVAKAVLERTGEKYHNNFKHAVRRLDEVSLNARGEERSQALARWLGALKDLDRDAKLLAEKAEKISEKNDGSPSNPSSPHVEQEIDEETGQPSRVTMVLFYDQDISSAPLTFRDVFLRSNALENITVSLILEPPEVEEVNLVMEMFGLCLSGGPEVHNAIVSGIQDLGRSVANYSELLLNRDDLLRMAADVITGLKTNAEIERLDIEAFRIESQVHEKLGLVTLKDTPAPKTETPTPSELVQGVLSDIPLPLKEGASISEELLQCGSRLVDIMKKKEALVYQGDTAEIRQLKVEKMKLLAEDLTNAAKTHKEKITDSRQQKSDAMAYRITKAQEVAEAEKVISQEMQVLQKRREELEAELSQVMQAITVQTKKHIQLQEEKEHFDEASSNIVAHLAIQEEECLKLMSQQAAEKSVVTTWQSFLEDTWLLQTSCIEAKEKAIKEATKETQANFWQIAIGHFVYRQEELNALLIRLKMYNEELATIRSKKADLEKKGMDGIVADITSGRKRIEEKYVETEGQVKNSLIAVERAKAELKICLEVIPEDENIEEKRKVEEFLKSLDVARKDFDAIKRPKLDIENPIPRPKKTTSKSSESWGRGPPGVAKPLPPSPTPVPSLSTSLSPSPSLASTGGSDSVSRVHPSED